MVFLMPGEKATEPAAKKAPGSPTPRETVAELDKFKRSGGGNEKLRRRREPIPASERVREGTKGNAVEGSFPVGRFRVGNDGMASTRIETRSSHSYLLMRPPRARGCQVPVNDTEIMVTHAGVYDKTTRLISSASRFNSLNARGTSRADRRIRRVRGGSLNI